MQKVGELLAKHQKALMGGGVLVGAALLGGQALRMIPKEALVELDAAQNEKLQGHAELYGVMVRMRRFGMLNTPAWARLLDRTLVLIGLESKNQLSTPRTVASVCAEIVMCVRSIRNTVKRKFEGALPEFDEVAAGLQEAVQAAQFNALQKAD